MRWSFAGGVIAAAWLAGCGGGIAVVGGDSGPAVSPPDAVDAGSLDRAEPTPDLPAIDLPETDGPSIDLVTEFDATVPDVPAVDTALAEVSTNSDLPVIPDDTSRDVAEVSPGDVGASEVGACAMPCAGGRPCCAGRCTDILNDPLNCGGCDQRCAPDRPCVEGACACPPGLVACGAECIPAICINGTGACTNLGPQRCVNGLPACAAMPGAPGTEVCNNQDDDCDGLIDEGLSQACFVGPGMVNVGTCRPGMQTCLAGTWGACVGAITATPETCDGSDEDCNGLADDGLPELPCFSFPDAMPNVGRCRGGLRLCVGGTLSTCRGEIGPLPEICNLEDDDCNGRSDDNVDPARCPPRANSRATGCVAGACQYACQIGFADCDGRPDNGCETATASDTANCGSCGNRCATGQFCDNGNCRANCSGLVCNGTCVDPNTSLNHCGACERVCSAPPGGTVECMAGMCVGRCPSGSTVCDGRCVNPASDPAHCGGCGMACRPGQACVSQIGSPGCVCTNGAIDCNGQCVNPQADALNCGACGNRCPGGSSCVNGSCRCGGTGPAPCGGTCAGLGQGCTAGIGACRAAGTFVCIANTVTCNAIPGTPTSESCNGVDDDCDGTADNSNAENSCPAGPFAFASCVSGRCGTACFPGRGDCDGMIANGCETDLLTSTQHCGRCNAVCTGTCTNGICAPCNPGLTACNNTCVDLRVDNTNCGRCGQRCPKGEGCALGACRPTDALDGGINTDGGLLDGGDLLGD